MRDIFSSGPERGDVVCMLAGGKEGGREGERVGKEREKEREIDRLGFCCVFFTIKCNFTHKKVEKVKRNDNVLIYNYN